MCSMLHPSIRTHLPFVNSLTFPCFQRYLRTWVKHKKTITRTCTLSNNISNTQTIEIIDPLSRVPYVSQRSDFAFNKKLHVLGNQCEPVKLVTPGKVKSEGRFERTLLRGRQHRGRLTGSDPRTRDSRVYGAFEKQTRS